MTSLDLATLRAAYESGATTPSRLIEELVARREAYDDPALWIHRLSRDDVLAHARRVEARGLAAQPLYGVPFAIKDNIDLAGVPTTAACPEFAYMPAESAAVVRRLLDAGAIPLGKVNLDQFATGLVGVRSPYGTPRNPFRADVIPGGSSSGSAVAVAAGLVSFALGTDTAGSGRVPAGLNGVVGLKPTRGAYSTCGVVPACRSLDCVSIFALNCTDAGVIGAVAEGFDPVDPFSRPRPVVPANHRAADRPLRIGVPAAGELEFFGDAEAERLFHASLARITALGAERVEIDLTPFRETAALLYQGPWIAERWAALRDFHRRHADAFFPVTRRIIEGGAAPTAADAFEGMYRRAALARRAAAEWAGMDVLLLPTAPRPYTLAEVAAEPMLTNSRLGTYTNFVNLLDLCALAVPAGVRSDGVPWGVTFIAPAWREPLLLELGAMWEGSTRNAGVASAQRGNVGPETGAEAKLGRTPPPPEPTVRLAVVGAHLSGLPLNHQLTDAGARLVWCGRTAAQYRLYALPGTEPAKPGMVRVTRDGAAIALEVWELALDAFGRFVAAIPPPLCIGSVALETGQVVKGFLCESAAVAGAIDITAAGGWRAYLDGRSRGTAGPDATT